MAIRLADTARPNNYIDAEHPGSFPVAYADDVWFADGTRLSEKSFDGQSIQVEELPLASADELGNIYQYVGETGTYTKGYFYECVSDGETPPTYFWKEAVGGSGYHFSEDFVEEEGNVSLAASQRIFTGTQAEWDALSTAVKKTYGQVNITDDESGTPEYYSTTETKTNKVWIDGKPIYRKVINFSALPNTDVKQVNHNISNIGQVTMITPVAFNGTTNYDMIPYSFGGSEVRCTITTTQISIRTNSNWSSSTAVVVIEYTKTTD